MGAIIQATDGNFYGTTRAGGTGGQGVVYKMTPAGVLTVLHNFANDTHGLAPFAGLVQATDGKFYGVTTSNPGKSSGVLFQITSTGTYTDLVFFSNVAGNFRGTNPQVSLVQHTNGTLFGDTLGGGNNAGCVGCGVLYSLNMGLGPSVSILPSLRWGKAGATIQFLGQGSQRNHQSFLQWSARNFHSCLGHVPDRKSPDHSHHGKVHCHRSVGCSHQQPGLQGRSCHYELHAYKRVNRREGYDHWLRFRRSNQSHVRRSRGNELHSEQWHADHSVRAQCRQDRKYCRHHAGRNSE